jgi:ankyrin repeat protein/serine/threonine protein kinase
LPLAPALSLAAAARARFHREEQKRLSVEDADDALSELRRPLEVPLTGRTVLGDRYFVHQVIDNGEHGTVYSGYDQLLRIPVAIKATTDPNYLRGEIRFLPRIREATHVPTVYSFGVENNVAIAVLELLPGQTLASHIRVLRQKNESFDTLDALLIIRGVLRALEKCHASGFTHNDVHPGNIQLHRLDPPSASGERWKVWLLDFGLCCDDTFQSIGHNNKYCSPQIRSNKRRKPEMFDDTYVATGVLYEMLALSRRDDAGLDMTNAKFKPQALETLKRSHVTAELHKVICQGLSVDEQKRYQTAASLIAALERCRNHYSEIRQKQRDDDAAVQAALRNAVIELDVKQFNQVIAENKNIVIVPRQFRHTTLLHVLANTSCMFNRKEPEKVAESRLLLAQVLCKRREIDVNQKDFPDRETALHALVQMRGCRGDHHKHEVCVKSACDIAQFLLDAGAKITEDHERRSPLHLCMTPKVAQVLLDANGKILNATDANGFTPLMAALNEKRDLLASFLIWHGGADVNVVAEAEAKNREGYEGASPSPMQIIMKRIESKSASDKPFCALKILFALVVDRVDASHDRSMNSLLEIDSFFMAVQQVIGASEEEEFDLGEIPEQCQMQLSTRASAIASLPPWLHELSAKHAIRILRVVAGRYVQRLVGLRRAAPSSAMRFEDESIEAEKIKQGRETKLLPVLARVVFTGDTAVEPEQIARIGSRGPLSNTAKRSMNFANTAATFHRVHTARSLLLRAASRSLTDSTDTDATLASVPEDADAKEVGGLDASTTSRLIEDHKVERVTVDAETPVLMRSTKAARDAFIERVRSVEQGQGVMEDVTHVTVFLTRIMMIAKLLLKHKPPTTLSHSAGSAGSAVPDAPTMLAFWTSTRDYNATDVQTILHAAISNNACPDWIVNFFIRNTEHSGETDEEIHRIRARESLELAAECERPEILKKLLRLHPDRNSTSMYPFTTLLHRAIGGVAQWDKQYTKQHVSPAMFSVVHALIEDVWADALHDTEDETSRARVIQFVNSGDRYGQSVLEVSLALWQTVQNSARERSTLERIIHVLLENGATMHAIGLDPRFRGALKQAINRFLFVDIPFDAGAAELDLKYWFILCVRSVAYHLLNVDGLLRVLFVNDRHDSLHTKTGDLSNALAFATRVGNHEAFRQIIEFAEKYGYPLSAAIRIKKQPYLHLYLRSGNQNMEFWQDLLASGALATVTDEDKSTALMSACAVRRFLCVKELIDELAVNVNAKNNFGESAMHVSCRSLRDALATIPRESEALASTTADEAISIIEYLIHSGAKVDEEDRFGFTPLYILMSIPEDALNKEVLEVIEVLLEAGANFDKSDLSNRERILRATYAMFKEDIDNMEIERRNQQRRQFRIATRGQQVYANLKRRLQVSDPLQRNRLRDKAMAEAEREMRTIETEDTIRAALFEHSLLSSSSDDDSDWESMHIVVEDEEHTKPVEMDTLRSNSGDSLASQVSAKTTRYSSPATNSSSHHHSWGALRDQGDDSCGACGGIFRMCRPSCLEPDTNMLALKERVPVDIPAWRSKLFQRAVDTKWSNQVMPILLLRLFFYLGFVTLVLITAFLWGHGRGQADTFFLSDSLERQLINEPVDYTSSGEFDKTFENLLNTDEIWQWVHGPMFETLYAQTGIHVYRSGGNVEQVEPGLFVNSYNRLVSPIQLRQIRSEQGNCEYDRFLADPNRPCFSSFNSDSEDTTTMSASFGYSSVGTAFNYSGGASDEASFFGVFAVYPADGYTIDLPRDATAARNTLLALQQNRWLDLQTRALVVEFSIHNPTVDVICIARLTLEQAASGAITPYYSFKMYQALQEVSKSDFAVVLVEILLLCYVIVYMGVEVLEIQHEEYRTRCHPCSSISVSDYWKSPFNYIDWFLYLTLIVLFIIRMVIFGKLNDLEQDFDAVTLLPSNVLRVSFQELSFILLAEKTLTGLVFFVLCCKLVQYMRVMKAVSLFVLMFAAMVKEYVKFLFFLFVIVSGFAAAFYVMFGTATFGFRNYGLSFFTGLGSSLGGLSTEAIPVRDQYRFVGPIATVAVAMILTLLLTNLLIAILNDSFVNIQSEIGPARWCYEQFHMIEQYSRMFYWMRHLPGISVEAPQQDEFTTKSRRKKRRKSHKKNRWRFGKAGGKSLPSSSSHPYAGKAAKSKGAVNLRYGGN